MKYLHLHALHAHFNNVMACIYFLWVLSDLITIFILLNTRRINRNHVRHDQKYKTNKQSIVINKNEMVHHRHDRSRIVGISLTNASNTNV